MNYRTPKSQNKYAFLNVYSGELLNDDLEGARCAIQVYFPHLTEMEMPKIESFVFERDREGGLYLLESSVVNRLNSLSDKEKEVYIARLISLLTTSITNFFKSFCRVSRLKVGMTDALEDPIEILQEHYSEALQVIKIMLDNGYSPQKIVDELDEKYWLYRSIGHYIK
jgi:hypothetical protein